MNLRPESTRPGLDYLWRVSTPGRSPVYNAVFATPGGRHMPAPQLPQDVATRDAELQAVAADTTKALALLRWQWTLDE